MMKIKKSTNEKLNKKICSVMLSSIMTLGIGSTAFAAPLSKLPNISDNTLVVGRHLFELDKVNNSNYNLDTFVQASKTVDDNNGVYYKYDGKWYESKDTECFNSLKNAKGKNTMPNDILKINGKDLDLKVNPKIVYKDGEYEGEGQGFKSIIKVKVTVENGKISKVDILHTGDTPGIFNSAKALINKIIKHQTTEVDSVTNATCSSKGIKEAVANALKKAEVFQDGNKETENPEKQDKEENKKVYKDGQYEGKGQGFNSNIKVKVTIKNNKINTVDIVEENESYSYFKRAKTIIEKIISKQTTEVDSVTNATCSSKGIKEAVKEALSKAEGSYDENKDKEDTVINNKDVLFTIDNFTQEGRPNKVSFTKVPKRVITTNQSTTELLLSLGLENHMVGTACADNDILPSLMEKYKKVPILAPMYPSAKVAEKQNPDFIIGWNSAFRGYSVGLTENWNNKGIPTFIQRNTVQSQSIDNAYKDMEEVGKIFNVEDKTDKLIEDLKHQIKKVEDKVKNVKNPVKVMAIEIEGKDDFYAYNTSHLVSDMIKKAGGVNIGDGKLWYASDIDYENPDVILVIRYNTQDVEESGMGALKKIDTLKDVNAIKNNKVIEVGLADIYPGGVRMADVVERLAKTFYPEKFNDSRD